MSRMNVMRGVALAVWTGLAAALIGQASTQSVTYSDATSIFESLRQDLIPAELRGKTPAELERAWPGWVSRRDAEIRARLERGDEDSILNLTLFGTTFTKLPRITERDIADAAEGKRNPGFVEGRIDDMIAGIASPGANERLQFARQVIERNGIDPQTATGRGQLRSWLDAGIARVIAEYQSHQGILFGPGSTSTDMSTLYRERGLSSDTTIFPGFGIEQALDALKSNGLLTAAVRRVAIVGPGLDFTDKREGYDFYPQQTIQPFAVIDSLLRLELARQPDLRVTTFDLSPRINHHLEAAREHARTGGAYLLQLPRSSERFRWTPFVESYWERFGDRIGEAAGTSAAPPGVASLQVRTVRVRPDVVRSIVPQDLNVVLQRPELPAGPAGEDARFDLIVATNVFLYYDVFEQALALVNVAKMLRPGGFLLTNTALPALPHTPMALVGYTDVGYTERPEADRIFWWERE